ncbi:MAG: hypothetical protein ACLP52_31820 [Streptosporangiaceae bacterium]
MTNQRKRRWRNPDKRMELAVALRAKGKSLRAIGADLHVDMHTVHRDLSRWEQQEVERLLSGDASADASGTPMHHPDASPWRSPRGEVMIRIPGWFAERLADVGGQVLGGELSISEGASVLADAIEDDPEANRAVAAAYAAKRLRPWTKTTAVSDQLDLFPDLPKLGVTLEVSVSRFRPVAEMTGADWDGALRQIETKEHNATGQAARVRAAYARVRPLLTDPSMTTADVVAELIESQISGAQSRKSN